MCRFRLVRLWLLLLLISFGGCKSIHSGWHSLWHGGLHKERSPDVLSDPQVVSTALENPLLIGTADYELLWNQLVEAVDTHFIISREQRVKQVGDSLTEGRIDTVPRVGSTYLEPWRRDSVPVFERLHATLQTIRRQAVIRVIPSQAGYLVEVVVYKQIEEVDRSEGTSIVGVDLRHDTSLRRQDPGIDTSPTTLSWLPLGRDTALEQSILADLQARMHPIP